MPSYYRHLPIVLLGYWLVVDVLVLLVSFQLASALVQLFTQNLLMGLLVGQLIVTTGWTVVGDRGLKTTWAAVVGIGLVLVSGLLFDSSGDLTGNGLIAVLLVGLPVVGTYGVLLNLPLVVARDRGWRFHYQPAMAVRSIASIQFSLRDLFVAMLLTGVLAAVWNAPISTRLPSGLQSRSFGSADDVRWMLSGLCGGFILPLCVWTIFRLARPIRAGLLALYLSCLWSIFFARVLGVSDEAAFSMLIPSAVMVVHLSALQLAGFRWRQRELPS